MYGIDENRKIVINAYLVLKLAKAKGNGKNVFYPLLKGGYYE
jgi:hypothetical protein